MRLLPRQGENKLIEFANCDAQGKAYLRWPECATRLLCRRNTPRAGNAPGLACSIQRQAYRSVIRPRVEENGKAKVWHQAIWPRFPHRHLSLMTDYLKCRSLSLSFSHTNVSYVISAYSQFHKASSACSSGRKPVYVGYGDVCS